MSNDERNSAKLGYLFFFSSTFLLVVKIKVNESLRSRLGH